MTTKNLNIQQKNEFLTNYYKKPNIHLVFKNQKLIKNYNNN